MTIEELAQLDPFTLKKWLSANKFNYELVAIDKLNILSDIANRYLIDLTDALNITRGLQILKSNEEPSEQIIRSVREKDIYAKVQAIKAKLESIDELQVE